MRKKKFRHIHRYAYTLTDIGNMPWINEHLYDLLTEPGKLIVRTQGYIVPTPKFKAIKVSCIKYAGATHTPRSILAMLRNRSKLAKVPPSGKILKKNPDRGITRIDQIPDKFIKRTPRWRK